MAETDLSDWLLAMEAALRIGCSTRTIERLGRDQKLETRLRPQAGTPPVVVYSPESVAEEALRRRREPAPFVLPAVRESVPGNGNGRAKSLTETPGSFLQTLPAASDPIQQLAALFLARLQSPPSPPVAESGGEPTLYLDVEQAARRLNWTPRDLRKAIRAGNVPGRFFSRKDWRTWRIKRTDLEGL